jgi:hypothetical protein
VRTKLTRYDFAAACLDTSILLFLKPIKGEVLPVRDVTAYLESIDATPFLTWTLDGGEWSCIFSDPATI